MRILPALRCRLVFGERFHDRRATAGLNRYHARSRAADPAEFFEFGKCLPHADEAGAAAGGIDDHIRKTPIQLFSNLIAHGLLAFHAIRLFQGRDIKPAFASFFLGDDAAAIIDEAVHQRESGAVLLRFDLIGNRSITRHEYVCFDACARRISRKRSAGVSRGRNRRLLYA